MCMEVRQMKKKINNRLKVIICILLSLCLTSCWSARELNKIAIVMAVGVDKGNKTNPVKMTVQIANVLGAQASPNGGQGGAGNTGYLNLTENGKSISQITREMGRKLSRKLFFSHNQVIIFGKDAAEAGIENYLDFFMRYRETRLLVWVLVSKGPTNEILSVQPKLENNLGRNIGELVKTDQFRSQIPSVNLKDFASNLMSKSTAPIAPMIEVVTDNNKQVVRLSGTAVFKKDKMVGILDKKETRGLLWCINKVNDGSIVLKTNNNNDTITIATTHASGKITPKIKNNELSMKIDIKQEGDLEEQTTTKDLSNPKEFATMEKSIEDIIKDEVMIALNKSRELNVDMFGFGDIVYRHYPKQWSKMEKDWDQIFKDIQVEVNVDSKLRRTGRITKPILFKGK